MNLNEICASLLEIVVKNLRSGNSNVNEEQLHLITHYVNGTTNYERQVGTDEAIKFLKVSRNYFYDYAKPRLKGVKIVGQKTIYYTKKELEEYRKMYLTTNENEQ